MQSKNIAGKGFDFRGWLDYKNSRMKGLTYKSSGVDIDEGDRLVRFIKPMAMATFRPGVLGGIGGFGALFSINLKRYRNPVLVSSTDGVGTKLKVAFMMDKHDTVGIDLVAMGVNDIITTGAEPLFFLDYFATGRLDAERASQVIKGIVRGCKEAGCSLVGGETAEMPDFYKPGEYDLAGFTVGVVERKRIIDGSTIKPGDRIIGLEASGLHSNGYSLARKVIFKKLGLGVNDKVKGLKKPIGEELLTPTRIYVKPVLELLKGFRLKGIAHITGGGFIENIPRVLPKGCKAVIKGGGWPIPFIFRFLQEKGGVSEREMFRTFNCGIGMVIVVSKKDEPGVLKRLKGLKERAYLIGEIVKRRGREEGIEII